MKSEMVILIAEDDESQAFLVERNLKKAGVKNQIIHFRDGREVLDFLHKKDLNSCIQKDIPYLLLLDIRMPVLDGKSVLKEIKNDELLKKMPVIMLTTSDDPDDINYCLNEGSSAYIIKPVDYSNFTEAIRRLGLFMLVISVPKIE